MYDKISLEVSPRQVLLSGVFPAETPPQAKNGDHFNEFNSFLYDNSIKLKTKNTKPIQDKKYTSFPHVQGELARRCYYPNAFKARILIKLGALARGTA